jgi:ELWxxDGT repeat protein
LDNAPNLGETCTAGLGACQATGVVACTDLGIGTARLKDIRPGVDGSNPEQLANVNGVVFFYAADGTHGPELWKSNGTESGTVLVKDSNPGLDGSFPGSPLDHLRNVEGTLFFYADDGTHGEEL